MENEILTFLKRCTDRVQSELKNLKNIDYGTTMGMGADGTPMKRIDELAESIVIDFIKDETDFGILSEEVGIVEGDGDGIVIMDPIDGTSNAVFGIPFYCISLAYTEGGLRDTEVGYVKNLVSGVEYSAVLGEGSYVNGHRLDPKLDDEWNFSVYLGKEAHPYSFEVASIPRRVRSLGAAALEISMVAEGTFDLYYMKTFEQHRSLRITDIAASFLILKEAGGEIYDGDLEPIDMNLDPKERKDVAAVHDDAVLEVLK
ncbi:MAG: inositol monophosphatase family protein [Candidatus Saliniplasma sp.]